MEKLFENIYALFVDGSLLDDLRDQGLIMPLSLSNFVVPLVGVIAFYYVINSVRFCKKRHWAITMFISALLVFIINISTCVSMAGKQIPVDASNPEAGFLFSQGNTVFTMFSLQMFLLACFYFFILSIISKWWSTNCRKTPF
jgi:O-antigen ligase